MEISPVGFFHCPEKYAYDVPRQGVLGGENTGHIELLSGFNYEQCLRDLDGFSRIWVIFGFHHNTRWKPMVMPPRHRSRKVGVFASRAPYRPNGLGLSCVELVAVSGLTVWIKSHDLLDGTPVYDLKPYLPYADSFPDASAGWTEEPEAVFYEIEFIGNASAQLAWLEDRGLDGLRAFIQIHLENEPLNARRNRLLPASSAAGHILAYRTWRIGFQVNETQRKITVMKIFSGYSPEELSSPDDRYQDKSLHRDFLQTFSKGESDNLYIRK